MKSLLKLLAVVVAFILVANYAEKKREEKRWENAAKQHKEWETDRQKPVARPEPPRSFSDTATIQPKIKEDDSLLRIYDRNYMDFDYYNNPDDDDEWYEYYND